MSTGDRNPTHRPSQKMEPRGFYLKTQFFPNFKMTRKGGLAFADSLCEYFEFDSFNLKGDEWEYSQSVSGSDAELKVIVVPSGIQIHATHPTTGLEWFETRLPFVYEKFLAMFKPRMVLGSSAMIRGIVQVDGDARSFIANNLLQPDLIERSGFKRPIHLLGLRFFFPPYKKSTKGKKKPPEETNWQVNVRVESLIDDPSKLFLEADADWPITEPWRESTGSDLVRHLTVVSEYINKTLLPMLGKLSSPRDDGGDSDESNETDTNGDES